MRRRALRLTWSIEIKARSSRSLVSPPSDCLLHDALQLAPADLGGQLVQRS